MVLMIAGFPAALHAGGNWYVRSGATGTGNGGNWSNAWTDVASINWISVAASDTIWIAGGNYGVLTIGKSGSTNAPIYIARVRSTNATPVAAAGWNSAFDSTVTIPRVVGSDCSWWTLDGQIPQGGIVVSNPSVSVGHGIYLGQNTFKSITLKNLLISGSVSGTDTLGVVDMRGIQFNGTGKPASSSLTVQYCTFQQYPTLILTININDILIEHCKFMKNYRGATDIHPNIWAVAGSTNVVFRFNEITEFLTEGIMMDFVSVNDSACDNWDIYGNLWHNSLAGWYGRAVESQYKSQYRIRIYNNTFVNLYATILLSNGGSWGSGCSLKNNIIYNCGTTGSFGLGDDDYNIGSGFAAGAHSISSVGSGIFANYSGKDYRIVGTVGGAYPKDKGVSLGSSYNTDMAGVLRGADGAWDIGAYEYTSGTNPPPPDTVAPTVALTSPVNGATVSNTVTLSATASDNPGGSGVASVTFLVDGVAAGSNTSSPYTLAWNSGSVTNGAHVLQARAVDVAGNQSTSSNVTVGILNAVSDATPPTVSLVSPVVGATVSNVAALSATASDNPGGSGVASVTFLVDGVAAGSDTTSPYTLNWNTGLVSNGVHTIHARAQDVAGNQTASTGVLVTVQNMPPAPPTLTNGLIVWWKFDEGAGTTAQDSSSMGNNGTLVAPANWGQGTEGEGLALNGTNGYVRAPSKAALEQVTTTVTIAVWARIKRTGGMQTIARKVVSETTNLYPYAAYDLVILDNGSTFTPRMGVTRVDSTRGLVYGAPRAYGSLCHFAGTFDGQTMRMYANGVEEGNGAFTGAVIQTSQPLCVGRYGVVTETMSGTLNDFRLYNRVLSAAEIQTLSHRPGLTSGLRLIDSP